jgi:hypothetical protein
MTYNGKKSDFKEVFIGNDRKLNQGEKNSPEGKKKQK